MISKNIYFISLIFLINFVSATTLIMSPPQIDFNGNVGERICQNITIKTDNYELDGEILFAEEGFSERKLSKHIFSAEDIDMDIDYEQNIFVENNKTIEVCIIGREAGSYHGALLYKIKNKPIRVGIWMKINLDGATLNLITGNAIKTIGNINILFWIPAVLFFALLILILILKRKKAKEIDVEKDRFFDELI